MALTIVTTLFPIIATAYVGTQYGDYLYYRINNDNTITITDCNESAVSVDIPAQIDGMSVTNIGDRAFQSCDSLTSVTIPDSVMRIYAGAFESCTNLTNIYIPGSVTYISDEVFSYCTNLVSITVNNDNPNYCSMDGNLFNKNKTELIQYAIGKTDVHYTIPDGITYIGYCAFWACTGLTSITIPDSVTGIGAGAFSGFENLTSINVDSGNPIYSSMDGNLFDKDKTSLILYATGKTDTAYTVPNGVTWIHDNAFSGCTSLTSVTIPDSVTGIGISVFSGCENLTSINVDNGNPDYCSVEGYLFNKDITALVQYAIGKTDTAYTVPNGTTRISLCAFSSCTNLTSVTIPDSVTSIGWYAFSGCTDLTNVYYIGTEAEWNQINILGGNDELLNANIHFLGDEYDIQICNVTEDKSERKISADFRNFSNKTQTFEAICAVYDAGGALITYENVTITVTSGETRDVTFFLSTSNWASYKLFAWDELGNMQPLSWI